MTGPGALRRLSSPPRQEQAPATPPDERCEFCNVGIGERHGHVADITDHRLLCVCRPCYLLFAPQAVGNGAGGGRYRGVGEQVRRVSDLSLDDARWDALRVPVDLVFFFRQTLHDASSVGSSGQAESHLLAFYPGPGGATESELDLAAWEDIAAGNAVLDDVGADVEAILLRRTAEGFTCHLVPVDLCYELVGTVRLHWTGLGGGAQVWREIDAFFDDLDRRSVAVSSGRPAEAAG